MKFSFKYILLVWSLIPLLLNCNQNHAPAPFPILACYKHDTNVTPSEQLSSLRYAGFTSSMVDFDPQQNVSALLHADSLDMTLFVSDLRFEQFFKDTSASLNQIDSVISEYSHLPAFDAYFLKTTPDIKNRDQLEMVKTYIQEKDQLHPVHFNLQPDYSTISDLNTGTFQNYLDSLLLNLSPASFSYTLYLNYEMSKNYYEFLEIIRDKSIEYQVPSWSFTISPPPEHYPYPEKSYLRVQVFSALAYGAKGLQYTGFQTHKKAINGNSNNNHAFIDLTSQIHKYIASINSEINIINSTLKPLISTGTFHSSPVPKGCSSLGHNLPVTYIQGEGILAGFFKNIKGDQFVLLVNKNFLQGAKPTIHFYQKTKQILETGKPNSIEPLRISWSKSENDKSISLLFKAGEGRLFKIIDY